ncbi:MAG: DUF4956 domain-containing protein [Opitutales bacterium]|jgi:hypothetical protein|nr:DUF4956 domain-containing protein [Opitutales bacterium]MBT5169178.1 DUF4956 domain-containing protein [Opitutales bacterium]MBT5814484.1 DUF4956 domain-containing protein [Opitutales bacterium]MDG2256229.1 DUF4956 domain-containing protein [Opitutaceae bacterium]
MQLQNSFTELFWNPVTIKSLPTLAISLITAAILGVLLGKAYVRFGTALSNRSQFARNFLLLTVTTTLIIGIVKSSLALSLGLVGALSIVRFRAAIKEPEELAFLFLSIAVGLGLGAGEGLVTVVAFILIIGLIALRSLSRPKADSGNLFLTINSPAPGKLTSVQILEALSAVGATASLKRLDDGPDVMRASFRVDSVDPEGIEMFSESIRKLSPSVEITCLEDGGLNH